MEVLSYGELRYLWLSNNHTFFTTILRMLCLDVAKCARNRKTAGNDPMRTETELLLRMILAWHVNVLN